MPTPLIVGHRVVLGYGDSIAVEASDFEIPAGAVTAIIGPNGAGKSTLLHAIAGLIEPIGGTLTVPRLGDAGVAYVLQATRVNELTPITVGEVVGMGRYAHLGMFKPFGPKDRQLCVEAMQRVGVYDLRTRHLSELSGGQRQRVFVAQGLAQEADLLLLDEPITGLDLVSREYIVDVVQQERELGTTVVGTTHDLSEAAMADHVLLLAGRVVAQGPPEKVLTAEHLSDAYGIPLVESDGVILDDAHHRGSGGHHVHFERAPRRT